ncbi:MAG: fumarate hydratase C-terminal domain-containing protein [Rhodobacterales bacterium]|nr:fumarate hydratase C-terminal domain-containing protein [Rhodobacterales bacterium]
MITEHDLTLPLTEAAVRAPRAGDVVYLTGEVFATAGLPTHDRLLGCLDGAESPPFNMAGGALFHLGSLNEDGDDGLPRIVYMNPTTSTRFDAHMPRLIPGLGLRATGGKGGLGADSVRAMAACGCVYLSFLGGGAPILTAAVRRVTGVGWPEMISHYRIVRLEVDRLGPLTVGIDAQGNSLYQQASDTARERRGALLDGLRA